jgi:peptidoglycan L-alanyl-D-glutamate endopeptidase CwlK
MLNETSKSRLRSVKPELQSVVELAAGRLPFDIIVVEGKRSAERQGQLYAQGRTAPGKIVTWTLNSKHITGDAVDLAPIEKGAILWADTAKFHAIAGAMFTAASELGFGIRWGKDWDQDGIFGEKGETDSPHFELTGVNKAWESKSSSVLSSPQSPASSAPKPTESPKAEAKQMQPEIKPTILGRLTQLLKPLTRK